MAIKRLQREAQFPNIGKLRKGGVKPETGNRPGEDLTYFRFDSDDRRAEKMFHATYGDQPSTINVFLPHQTTEQNFSCWQEHWLAGGLQHRCDGETCVIWFDKDSGKYSTESKPCPGGCKEVGRLMVIIPELQRFAFVTAETHSVHDIMRLTENLQAVEYLRGDLRGIPFILKRTPVEISTPSVQNGKRATREKWLLSIEVDPAWAALQLESMHRNALSVDGVVVDDSRLLSVVDDEDPQSTEWDAIPGAAEESIVEDSLAKARKAFHAEINKHFNGDSNDARHWLIEGFTAKRTPNNVRRSAKDLNVAELDSLRKSLAQYADDMVAKWQAHKAELDVITVDGADELSATGIEKSMEMLANTIEE